jgi:CheY-like chemotaxis protein
MQTPEVFLVEDNPADVLLIRVALSQVPFPPKLLVAHDGEQALAMLSSVDFHPMVDHSRFEHASRGRSDRPAAIPWEEYPHCDL